MQTVPDERATPAEEQPAGTPVGRRVILSMLGLGALGLVAGPRLQDAFASSVSSDLASLLPSGGRFRIYTVVGFLPERSKDAYRLTVTGMVDRPLELTYAALTEMTPTSITADFQCVTGWRVPDVPWVGVRLADILDAAGVKQGAKALRFTSFDGVYTESLTLDQARRNDVIVAYSMEGGDISSPHGGPVRLYVAPMYGYKSIKWLDGIEVTDAVQPGYWEVRGYDVDAWVGASNRRSDAPIA